MYVYEYVVYMYICRYMYYSFFGSWGGYAPDPQGFANKKQSRIPILVCNFIVLFFLLGLQAPSYANCYCYIE